MQLTGRLLADRYDLDTLIASGGMGQVWRANDTLLRRPVAVKVLRSDVSGDPTFLARFRAEAQHSAGLAHQNIAAVYDYGEVPADGEHRAFLVMELVEGESLAALLERERRLSVPLTLSILRQIAAALTVAHAAGVIHRDIKPANVLITRDGLVKITDFGIAFSASSLPLTRTGQVVGTANYLSPEQAQGEKASPASDVYAAGAVAYECLAGRRAFDGESPVQVALMQIQEAPAPLPPDLPAPVRALVERALVKDPAQRYPDGATLRAAVEQVIPAVAPAANRIRPVTMTVPLPLPNRTLSPNPTSVLPAGAAGPAPTSGRGRGPMIAAAILLVAFLLAGGIGLLLGGRPTTTASSTSAPSTAPASSAPSSVPTSEPPSTPPPPTSAPAPPPPVQLAAADFVGRPVTTVRAHLTALGLQVRLDQVRVARVPAGTVVAINPSGPVAAGSTVTVTYVVSSKGSGNDGGSND